MDEKASEMETVCSFCSKNVATTHRCDGCTGQSGWDILFREDFLRMKWQPEAMKDYANVLISLQAADGECVPVHGFILASRSRVFDVMLKSNMVEGRTKMIKLEDMSNAVMHSFVHFLYSAHVSAKDLQQHSPGLFLAANKYEVKMLKWVCEEFMIKNLSKDHILSYLEVAYLCDCNSVMKAAFAELSKCYNNYQLDEEFHNLAYKHPRLAVEFCRNLLSQVQDLSATKDSGSATYYSESEYYE